MRRSAVWTCALLAASVVMGVAAGAATVTVPGDYATIQAAINAASAGDTIAVAAGTYSESLTVNKALTIVGGPGCKLQGAGSGNGILIKAADVTVDGLEVTGFAIAVRSYGGPANYGNLTVANSNLHHNAQNGILLVYDTFNTVSITNTTIANNNQNGIGIGNGTKISALELADTTIQGNKNNGLYIANAGTTISSGAFDAVTFASNAWQGVHIEGGAAFSNVTMTGGALQANQFGIVTKASTITNFVMDGVVVQNNTGSGLTFTGTVNGLTVANCVFVGNAWEHLDLGLSWMGALNLSNGLIEGNVFGDGPWYSVLVQSATFAAGQLRVTENEFLKAWSYGVLNYTANLVLAYNNWWGSASGPNVVAYASSNVAYSPWLANGIAASPWTFIVDDRGPVAAAGYLQPALDTAADGDTVHVNAGSYSTQGLISTSIVLEGDPGATILGAGSKTYTVAESSNTFAPILFAYGGTMTGTHVSGSAVILADVLGLDINGQNAAPASPHYVGVLLRNVEGTVAGNTIHDMYDADGEGDGPQTFGILVYGDSDVGILDNAISEFSRGGIVALGDGGAAADPNVLILGNTVTGNGYESGTGWWAENGIQIGKGATGSIIGNIVSDCTVNNPGWASSGILVSGSDGVLILGNTTTGNDIGVAVGGPATGTVIQGNDILGNTSGIGLQTSSVDTIVVGNVLSGNTGEAIYIYGYGSGLPVGTVFHYNSISGNGYGVVNYETGYGDPTVVMDGALNWWGSADGPYFDPWDGGAAYAGGGGAVYGNVIFSPWLGNDPDGDAGTTGVQITGPMVIVVDDVGPAPTGGYLDAAIGGSNDVMLPYEDAIVVMDGDYTASTALTDGVALTSDCGACKTSITGSLAVDAGNTTIGRIREGFAVHGPITVGTGVDAGTIHINWNDIYGIVANDGTGRLDAAFNYWGADGPETTGIVDTYPILPVSSCVLISYIDEYGLRVMEAITFARLLERGLPVGQAKLAAQIAEEYGLGIGDVMALIREYGLGRVRRAYFLSDTLDEFLLQLAGYRRDAAGGGGGLTGDLGSYPVGAAVPLSYALMAPFSEEPAAGAIVSYTLVRMIERPGAGSLPIPELIRLGVLAYDAALEMFVATLDTTGLEPGSYEVWIGADDGWSTKYALTLTE